jgi:hypothetical protein
MVPLHLDLTAIRHVSCKMSQLCFETFPVGNLIRSVSFQIVLFKFIALRSVKMDAAGCELLIFVINTNK